MSSSHYDHEQDEIDFFERESLKSIDGCARSSKILVLLILILIGCLVFFTGCKTAAPPVVVPYGPVISIDGDRIEVAFEVINKEPGSQLAGWFYVPGHRFVKGNIFPDFSKYKHPVPRSYDRP